MKHFLKVFQSPHGMCAHVSEEGGGGGGQFCVKVSVPTQSCTKYKIETVLYHKV